MEKNNGGGLRCGAARRLITPSEELITQVRGLMGARYVTVADDIYLRVLAVECGGNTWLLCGFDLDKAPNVQKSIAGITEKYGIPEEYITIYGIHTHSAPIPERRMYERRNDASMFGSDAVRATERYAQWIYELLLDAVGEALDRLAPARLRFGTAPCGCNINRCADSFDVDERGNVWISLHENPNPLGPADHNVYVLVFEGEDGGWKACLVNYAMHNTVMFQNPADEEGNCAISSDVGGNVSQMLERRFPGTVALWCSGAAGDVAPLRPSVRVKPGLVETAQSYAWRQQYEILKRLSVAHYGGVMLALNQLSEPLACPAVRAGIAWTQTPGRQVIREEIGGRPTVRFVTGPEVEPYRIRLHFVLLGDLLIMGVAGELYSDYARQLREHFPEYRVLVINHDASGLWDANYIMDDDTWNRIAKLPPEENTIPGAPPRYEAGYIGPAILEAAERMLQELKG